MDSLVINEYQGFVPRCKELIKRLAPGIFERFLKAPRVLFIEHRRRPMIRAFIKRIAAQQPLPLFELIEIETINRCNGKCSFCPVNRAADTRTLKVMEESLFRSILGQLAEAGYRGKVGLYSNNEPLLDARIVELAALARQILPAAQLFLMTNGTLLTEEKFIALMRSLDRLIIDNYDDDLRLIEPVRKIADYCRRTGRFEGNVRIWLRKEHDLLTNRAGQAGNRTPLARPLRCACAYPFTQMIVRPDGKVSLCCNDALGRMTMGDLGRERLVDVWRGPAFEKVRTRLISSGRSGLPLCGACDSGGL